MKKAGRPLTIMIGLAVLAIVYSVFKIPPKPTTNQHQIKNAMPAADAQSAQQNAIKELSPDDAEELITIAPGDIKSLEKVYKEKTGLSLKEVRENPDGTYDAVLVGAPTQPVKQAAIITDRVEQERFQKVYIQNANKGKTITIDEKDRAEVEKFRRSLGR